MKITLAMVISLDGKTTKWGESRIHEWTSKEDQDYFSFLTHKSPLIIMGRKTFDAARKMIKLSPEILRIVMTRTPERHAEIMVLGQLEFTSHSPSDIVKELEDRGYKKALLIGGEQINTEFFKQKLVNELWLTIEPNLFGIGNQLVLSEKLDVDLTLQSVEKLNEKGTLLLKYKVNVH